MKLTMLAKWRASFVTGLLVILPAAVSILIAVWIIRNITGITDILLVFLPRQWTHSQEGEGPLYWYYSVLALSLALVLITALGYLAKNYIGRKILKLSDDLMLRLPLVNKIYSAIKQVNEAFSGKKASFKQVVLLEFPRQGIYSMGFITNDKPDISVPNTEALQCVFVPTTPNPTTGFIVMVPASSLHRVNLSVPEAVKFIITLGSLSADQQQESLKNLP